MRPPPWKPLVRPREERTRSLQARLSQHGFILAASPPPGRWVVLQSMRSVTPVRRLNSLDQVEAFVASLEGSPGDQT